MAENFREKMTSSFFQANKNIRSGNREEACRHLGEFLQVGAEMLKMQTVILQQAKTKALLQYWLQIYKELKYKGITNSVSNAFRIYTPAVNYQRRQDTESAETSQGWIADLYEKNKLCVVEIFSVMNDEQSYTKGTGVIISDQGYILTNKHVIYDEENEDYCRSSMKPFNSQGYISLTPIDADEEEDIALCSFVPSELATFGVAKTIKNYDSLQQGADIVVIGNAFGFGLAPIAGQVRFTYDNNGFLVYTAPINPGDSGAPVFNRAGEVIGINKSKYTDINGERADCIGNASPMKTIDSLLKQWKRIYNLHF